MRVNMDTIITTEKQVVKQTCVDCDRDATHLVKFYLGNKDLPVCKHCSRWYEINGFKIEDINGD